MSTEFKNSSYEDKDNRTFVDSDNESEHEDNKDGIYDFSDDEGKSKKKEFSKYTLQEIKEYLRNNKNPKGKAVERCIIATTQEILKDKYKDVIKKNGVITDTVKKRVYFTVKAKKLKKSIGSILIYKDMNTEVDFKDYKLYVILYGYKDYITKKNKEYISIKNLLKKDGIDIRLVEDMVK